MNVALLISIAGFTLAVLSFVLSRIVTRRIRVTVHKAGFDDNPPYRTREVPPGLTIEMIVTGSRKFYFVNITNVSLSREVEITHVWFDCTPKVYVMRPERPLPKRLKVDETWETWVAANEFPPDLTAEAIYNLARVRLSTSKVYHSQQNRTVPSFGTVPGGRPPKPPAGTI